MVVRHGSVLASAWWKPYTEDQPHIMFSVSKSFTSTAVGIAQDEGRLSVDEPVLDFFPSLRSASIVRNMSGVRVRDLLTMASGHDFDTASVLRALPREDWVNLFLQIPRDYPAGQHFCYNSGASFTLAAMVAARTGTGVLDYLTPRLFDPLGIVTPPWERNSRGIELGWTGLRLRTEDLAKFGQLYLREGEWNGQRILSREWVAEATAGHVDNADGPAEDWRQGYGFQFWRSRHNSFRSDGAFGQFSIVLPEHDMVVAMTAGTDRNREIPGLVWDHLLPEIQPDALPENDSEQRELIALSEKAELPLPATLAQYHATPSHRDAADIVLALNTLGVESVGISFLQEAIEFTVRTVDGSIEQTLAGRDARLPGHTRLLQYEEIDGADTENSAGWISENTLELTQQCLQTPFARVWRFTFAEDRSVEVIVQLIPGPWIGRIETIRGTLRNRD
jgi:CubicO group peptidase (beta-lactamase class C family)